MLAKRIIPCLDVQDGMVVKGIHFEGIREVGDPVECAVAYDRQGADEICFLDITATHEGRGTMVDVVRRTAKKVFVPLTVGGGVRTIDDYRQILRAGADKVSVNSAAIRNPELIRRAKRGDVKAFSRLYAGIYKDLYRFALCTTRHTQDAEDAVSEAVAAAYENIGKLQKEESFRNWMFTILNNQCRKILKNRNKTVSADEQEETGREAESAAGQEMDYAEQHDVRAAFAALEEEERMIVAFSVFGGYRSEEIASMLDKNAATVRSRKSRALGKMRRFLEKEY